MIPEVGQRVRFTRASALGWQTEPFTIEDVDLDRDHPLVFDGTRWRSARYLQVVEDET